MTFIPLLARLRHLTGPVLLAICASSAWSQAAMPTAAPASASSNTVVLRAGKLQLTKSEYEKLALGFDRAAGAVLTGRELQSLQSGQDMGRLLALVSEAQKRGLDQDAKMQAMMRVRTYVLLANSLRTALLTDARNDEAGTRALWEAEKNNYVDVVARQILVRYKGAATVGAGTRPATRTEAQAQAMAAELYKKLKNHADFAALAKSSSDDETTRARGGELEPFGRGSTVAEFETVAFSLPPGGLSTPFKTKYGWHILEVLERRPYPFDRIKATLEFERAQRQLEAIATTGVTLDDSYFKP